MKLRHAAAVTLLIAVAVARVVSTYPTFAGTFDEPWHVLMGMEPLQFGSYTYEHKHPPLSRVAVAIGPYLAGARAPQHRQQFLGNENVFFEDGNALLYSGPGYDRNLTLARLGALPFFAILCITTFLWARRWFSPEAGWWALVLITCTAPVLGHAGVAAIDLPGAAGLTVALYAFLRWMESPSIRTSAWFGAATAFAFLTKLSNVAFLAAAVVLALAFAWRHRPAWRQFAIASMIAFFCLWAGYGFTVKRLGDAWGPRPRIDARLARHPSLAAPVNAVLAMPLPLTELITGVRDVTRHDSVGHDSFLLGKYSNTGWWYFFPVVLAVKTPLGLLLLAIAGAARLKQAKFTVLFASAILCVCIASRIDLGVRHILAIYPLLAILGASVVQRSRSNAGIIALALVSWTVADSLRAHPDYLAHFNELFGAHPEKVLGESDLDWGQDLRRLSHRLRDLKVERVAIAYFGSALLEKSGLPLYQTLDPLQPTTGWIAISLHHRTISRGKDGSYAWLDRYLPRERVGKSIDLYFIPE